MMNTHAETIFSFIRHRDSLFMHITNWLTTRDSIAKELSDKNNKLGKLQAEVDKLTKDLEFCDKNVDCARNELQDVEKNIKDYLEKL